PAWASLLLARTRGYGLLHLEFLARDEVEPGEAVAQHRAEVLLHLVAHGAQVFRQRGGELSREPVDRFVSHGVLHTAGRPRVPADYRRAAANFAAPARRGGSTRPRRTGAVRCRPAMRRQAAEV